MWLRALLVRKDDDLCYNSGIAPLIAALVGMDETLGTDTARHEKCEQ